MSAWAAVAQTAGQTFNLLYNNANPTAGDLGNFGKQVYADQKARQDSTF